VRRRLLIVAVLCVVAGIPLALVALTGGDDDPSPAPQTRADERAADVPPGQAGGERGEAGGNGKARGKGGGGNGRPAISEEVRRDYPASENVAYPADVTPAGAYAANAVERVLGGTASKADQLTVLGADCRAGACSVRYVSGPHGGGRIASDAAHVLRLMFRRGDVRSVTLYVHEPRGKSAKEPEPMALLTARCRRSDHPRFRWARIDEGDLDRRCRTVERSPGKLGSQIKRGQLSEKDASRGRETEREGGGTRKREAPRTVPGSKNRRNGDDRQPDVPEVEEPIER